MGLSRVIVGSGRGDVARVGSMDGCTVVVGDVRVRPARLFRREYRPAGAITGGDGEAAVNRVDKGVDYKDVDVIVKRFAKKKTTNS